MDASSKGPKVVNAFGSTATFKDVERWGCSRRSDRTIGQTSEIRRGWGIRAKHPVSLNETTSYMQSCGSVGNARRLGEQKGGLGWRAGVPSGLLHCGPGRTNQEIGCLLTVGVGTVRTFTPSSHRAHLLPVQPTHAIPSQSTYRSS